jgi:hypothetical protein
MWLLRSFLLLLMMLVLFMMLFIQLLLINIRYLFSFTVAPAKLHCIYHLLSVVAM